MESIESGVELRWALPEGLDVPPDRLRFRVDIYGESILLHKFGEDGSIAMPMMVSAQDIARAFARKNPLVPSS